MRGSVAVPEMTHSSAYFGQDRQLKSIPQKLSLNTSIPTEPARIVLRGVDRRTQLDVDNNEYERTASAQSYQTYSIYRFSPTPLSTISLHQQYPAAPAHKELGHAGFSRASDLERGSPQAQKQHRNNLWRSSRDTSPQHRQRQSDPTSIYVDDGLYEEVDCDSQQPENHALWILTYLSILNPFLAALLALHTLLTLVLLTLLAPLRLCSTRAAFSSQLTTHLGPALNLQLLMIYSSYAAPSDSRSHNSLFSTNVTTTTAIADHPYNTLMLLILLIMSPILSLPVAIASWIVAVFWFYAVVIGDPTPNGVSMGSSYAGKRDDGKATVMGVRNWWERCLVQSLRENGIRCEKGQQR